MPSVTVGAITKNVIGEVKGDETDVCVSGIGIDEMRGEVGESDRIV